MKDTYLAVIDTRSGNPCHTGIGAIFDSKKETRKNFENARQVAKPDGAFLLDLIVDGDLVDTIHLDAAGVEAITGCIAEAPEHYVEFDRLYWENIRSA